MRAAFADGARAFRQDFEQDAFHGERRDVVGSQKLAIHPVGEPGRGQAGNLAGTGQHRRMIAQTIERQRLDSSRSRQRTVLSKLSACSSSGGRKRSEPALQLHSRSAYFSR